MSFLHIHMSYRMALPVLPGILLLLLPATLCQQPPLFDTPWAEGSPSLEKEVALLTARVANSLEAEQRLVATNAQLRREIAGWEDVGNRVMHREARIVDVIKQANGLVGAGQPSLRAAVIAGLTANEPHQKAPVALVTRSAALSDSKSQTRVPSVLASWQIFVFAFTLLVTIVFCWARAPFAVSNLLKPARDFELSELQLEGLPTRFGECYLLVQPSGGLRSRTRVAMQSEGSSLFRFDEVLSIPMCKGDSPCTIAIFRRDDEQDMRIGTAYLGPSELLSRSVDVQYFRFKVQAEAVMLEQEAHVAMRIRDLGRVLGGSTKGKAGMSSRPKSWAQTV